MSNVNLSIGGRRYVVACTPGEEAHLTELGRAIDAKVTDSGVIAQNETRMLLFASLMLADELHEVRRERDEAVEARAHAGEVEATVRQRIERIGERVEALANGLDVEDRDQDLEESGKTS